MSRSALTSMCQRCQTRLLCSSSSSTTSRNIAVTTTTPIRSMTRTFSTTPSKPQDADDYRVFEAALGGPRRQGQKASSSSSSSPSSSSSLPNSPFSGLESLARGARDEASTRPSGGVSEDEPYHLNVYSHKHNMHITFTNPSRDPIISYSAGNLGLRKAQRGSFDAAYQLSTYTMRKMAEKQWRIGGKNMTQNKTLTLNEAEVRERGIEIVLRGYGPGREAFQKALLGNEGKIIKPLIRKLTDGTRLKFGGTRSPQVRRLG